METLTKTKPCWIQMMRLHSKEGRGPWLRDNKVTGHWKNTEKTLKKNYFVISRAPLDPLVL